MLIKVLMPALSPTMTHGNIVKWFKKEGDRVFSGEVIAEIETDKATMEVEAVEEGTLVKILVTEGTEDVKVNTLIAVLSEEEADNTADIDDFIKSHNSLSISTEKNLTEDSSVLKKFVNKDITVQSSDNSESFNLAKDSSMSDSNKIRVKSSPLARRIAREKNISLSDVVGTGPHGRVIKNDVINYYKNRNTLQKDKSVVRVSNEYKEITNSNYRKIIAKRLVSSKVNAPHFYVSITCIVDHILKIREELNLSVSQNKGVDKLSINDFIIMSCAKALKIVPKINASWDDDKILVYNNIDIAVAVSTENGLITPIIYNADQKSIFSISLEMRDLIKKAKMNKLKPSEFQGGGFSISNLGMYGVDSFSAIINPPQSCILAVGAVQKKPVVVRDSINIKSVINITASFDHRVIDGVIAAEFLSAVKNYIESPITMFI